LAQRLLASSAILSLIISAQAYAEQGTRIVNTGTPEPECTFRVNFDRNADMPGYSVERSGGRICVPFMPTNQLVPSSYTGKDFYGEEFTDAKIKARWAECKKSPGCAEPAIKGAKGFVSAEKQDTGTVDPAGKIEPEGEVDLTRIRRPAYFAKAPYNEPIAQAEPRTFTVEFTVPRDNYERLHLKKEGQIKLRGWYVQGTGVDNGAGRKVRALVIMNNGGGSEFTAINDPRSQGAVLDQATGNWVTGKFPDGVTEEPGIRHWRGFINALNQSGFDVLVTDRRGNGISGGVSGYNTAEQANDMFRELEQLDTGEGLRALTPSGEILVGKAAAEQVLAGQRAREVPVVIGGYSRGSYATAWAMHKNFVEDCNLDLPDGGCKPARGWSNIKGAILYGPNSAGLGYRAAGHDMIEAALRVDYNTTYYPDSGVLANVTKWPPLQVMRGTWDYVEGLEGSFDAYKRVTGLKDIFVFRGPHALNTQAPENMKLAGERMAAFARAAVLGNKEVQGAVAPANLKELVASSPDHWESTTAPKQ
jgi:pimeloyl-ACP methyl ester carboxylesterase